MQRGTPAARSTVVLDSNVLVSGLQFASGNPASIVDPLSHGEIVADMSPFILEEVTGTLRNTFRWTQRRIDDTASFLRRVCTIVEPPQRAAAPELSTEDNRVLDCAAFERVEFLVTGDRKIQELEEFEGIKIVSTAQFLASLGLSE